ncbi:hypothetical protein EA796_00945 [Pseudomonas sp. AOB-7]|uniref:hypothetical protein n=1 Tax=Pseudomonas sp. AOB-7 TaxID=2482750 RepID=UPI000EFBB1B2|nr:hypothetical protein [Pseudomonas sp. AOB-7]RMH86429.1 hypothetical protein EA796_00945 [Pseudomonas sp. AOB-7]
MSQHIIPMVLGGVPITPHSGPVRMRYEPFGGSAELRMADGTGIKQTHWRKTRILASGSGPLEPALEHLDYSGPLELWCVKPLAISGTALQYQLPAAASRRPDVAPWAWAEVAGRWQDVAVAMDGDLATLTPPPGAGRYQVFWLPRYSVLTDGLVTDWDESQQRCDWSLEARER